MFNGVIDSREVRAQRVSSSSRSLGGSSLRHSEQELEVARLREELRQRDEYARAQQEYYASYNAQQQAAIQVSLSRQQFAFEAFTDTLHLQAMFQQMGQNIVFPEFQPPPPPPQWGMHPPAPSPAAQVS